MKKESIPVNVELPAELVEAMGTIKAKTRLRFSQIYAEAVQSFVLRYQREVKSVGYSEEKGLDLVFDAKPTAVKSGPLSENTNFVVPEDLVQSALTIARQTAEVARAAEEFARGLEGAIHNAADPVPQPSTTDEERRIALADAARRRRDAQAVLDKKRNRRGIAGGSE